jgi:crotonobetainyl-CoA:carnitine CoA-transferase CaiB-like acyl-CoA transferase
MNLHRNKRSVSLDLKHPDGRATALHLATTADVVVTNLRPGPLARLGLGYEEVAAVRPDVVYCQAQGWSTESGHADDPAYDDVIQSASGITASFALAGREPALVPTLLADKVCGLVLCQSVLAALLHRARTGEGQHLEVPMVDVMRSFTLVEHIGAAASVPPAGPVGHTRILTPQRRPHRAADTWVHVLPYSAQDWIDVFAFGGRPELADDPRIHDRARRYAESGVLYARLAEVIPNRTAAEWLELCRARGIPSSAVVSVEELVAGLPEAEHPVTGTYKFVPSPVRWSRTPPTVGRHAPRTG